MKHAWILSFSVLALAFLGCTDADSPLSTQESDFRVSSSGFTMNPYDRPSERMLDDLAKDVAGFGGMYSDSTGVLHVYIAELPQLPQSELNAISRIQAATGTLKPVVFHQGAFSIQQLRSWQPSVDFLLALPGVLSTDLDEASNRLRVGVLDMGTSLAVAHQLLAAGVPREAVQVVVEQPVQLAKTLSDSSRPLRGGNIVDGAGDECSMSFNAIDIYGRDVFLNASHCTGSLFDGVNGVAFYQPDFPNGFVGTEVSDPALFSCFNGTRLCRWSDAASIEYDNSSNSDLGRIHKTKFRDQYMGSTEIDPSDPYFSIVEETAAPSSSEIGDLVLNKMGYNTGWTNGRLISTCVNKTVLDSGGGDTGITLLCQDAVDANVQGGDSGAPVFRKIGGNQADLYGLLWGRQWIGGWYPRYIFWFSSMFNIESELGYLTTF